MTEENNLEQEGANFADMLAAHEEEQASNRLEVGQKVQARVVAITTDTVFVSTGSKVDGLVERAELEHDGVVEVKEGDVLDLFVVHVSSQEVRLSRVVRGSGSLNLLEDAKASAIPVEGKVTGVVKGGFSIDVMRRRAFCPLSQIDARPVETPEALVGQIFKFLVTRLEKGGRNIVVSRRGLIEAEQAESREAFLAGVKEGDVLEGAVRRLTQFGAFVELAPGVEGMVHVSELSWSRVRQPDEMIGVGDQVRVKVLALGKTEKGWRLSLSMRQVTEDPWLSVADRLHSGDLVRGKVARASSFGAFVEVLPGIEGLIHISELSWEKRVNKAEEVVTVGEEVLVKVKEVDAEKRRVSLSLRDVAGDPWAAVPADFPVGSEHKGVVEKRAAFGLFICLAPGVTGLMPNSMMGPRGNNKYAKLGAGMEAEVRISEMNLEARKLTLAPAGVEEDEIMSAAPDRSARDGARSEGRRGEGGRGRDGRPGKGGSRKEGDDWKQHAKAESSSGSFGGSLGAALADALKKKTEK